MNSFQLNREIIIIFAFNSLRKCIPTITLVKRTVLTAIDFGLHAGFESTIKHVRRPMMHMRFQEKHEFQSFFSSISSYQRVGHRRRLINPLSMRVALWVCGRFLMRVLVIIINKYLTVNIFDFSSSAHDAQYCTKLYKPYEGIFHSGLPISHTVNVDYCLAHCSITSFNKALIVNGVHCVCTNRTFANNLYSYNCRSPKPINNMPAAWVFNRINLLTTLQLQLSASQTIDVYEPFSFHSTTAYQYKNRTVFYDLGDGTVGKRCSLTLHR